MARRGCRSSKSTRRISRCTSCSTIGRRTTSRLVSARSSRRRIRRHRSRRTCRFSARPKTATRSRRRFSSAHRRRSSPSRRTSPLTQPRPHRARRILAASRFRCPCRPRAADRRPICRSRFASFRCRARQAPAISRWMPRARASSRARCSISCSASSARRRLRCRPDHSRRSRACSVCATASRFRRSRSTICRRSDCRRSPDGSSRCCARRRRAPRGLGSSPACLAARR